MATKKNLINALAQAREAKAAKAAKKPKPAKAPNPAPQKAPDMQIITNPAREIAADTTRDAMIMGWDQSIQKHAYENRVPEERIREILDEALEYEEKSDPAGRIEGLQDWEHEKRGSSVLAAPAGKRA